MIPSKSPGKGLSGPKAGKEEEVKGNGERGASGDKPVGQDTNKLDPRREAGSQVSQDAEMEFYCPECGTCFVSAQKIYEHTKKMHLLSQEQVKACMEESESSSESE